MKATGKMGQNTVLANKQNLIKFSIQGSGHKVKSMEKEPLNYHKHRASMAIFITDSRVAWVNKCLKMEISMKDSTAKGNLMGKVTI